MTRSVVPYKQKAEQTRAFINKLEDAIARSLPKHLTPERMTALAFHACTKNPSLMDCTRLSLGASIIGACQMGLEPLITAHIVPFKIKGQLTAQVIPDYRGLMQLARNTGKVTTIQAFNVRQGDEYAVSFGTDPGVFHRPSRAAIHDEIVATYATARVSGDMQFAWLWTEEVDAYRDRSRARNSGPWKTDEPAMRLKTALRRLCNLLPQSPELQLATQLDNAHDRFEPQHEAANFDLPSELIEEAKTEPLDDEAGADDVQDELTALGEGMASDLLPEDK